MSTIIFTLFTYGVGLITLFCLIYMVYNQIKTKIKSLSRQNQLNSGGNTNERKARTDQRRLER
jgi:uncharacterized membrane protein